MKRKIIKITAWVILMVAVVSVTVSCARELKTNHFTISTQGYDSGKTYKRGDMITLVATMKYNGNSVYDISYHSEKGPVVINVYYNGVLVGELQSLGEQRDILKKGKEFVKEKSVKFEETGEYKIEIHGAFTVESRDGNQDFMTEKETITITIS